MLNSSLESILNKAIRFANERRHEYISLENILYAMLDDDIIGDVFGQCGVDIDKFKKELEDFLFVDDNFSILSDEAVRELSERQFANEQLRKIAASGGIFYQPEISLSLQRVIQRAAVHVQSAGKKTIHAHNILVAMFSEKNSFAVYLLQKNQVSRMRVVEIVAHHRPYGLIPESVVKLSVGKEKSNLSDRNERILKRYTINLNGVARDKKLDPIIGRDKEIKRMVQILGRRQKNNPILVGDSGVGKTSIVEGLVQRIESGNIPKMLKGVEIYSLNMTSLLAGAKFRGDFEERMKSLLDVLSNSKDKKRVLFIDEIHTIIGAGATTGGNLDFSNLLKPSLGRGGVRCIGSTTYDEYRKHFSKDIALVRRFQKIDVEEPSLEDTFFNSQRT